MEYEDVFPYKEKYEVLRAKNSYRYTVHNIMQFCINKESNLFGIHNPLFDSNFQ